MLFVLSCSVSRFWIGCQHTHWLTYTRNSNNLRQIKLKQLNNIGIYELLKSKIKTQVLYSRVVIWFDIEFSFVENSYSWSVLMITSKLVCLNNFYFYLHFVWKTKLRKQRKKRIFVYLHTSFLPDVSKISSLILTPDNVNVPWFVCSDVGLCLIGKLLFRKRQINAVLPTFSGPNTTIRYGSSRLAALSIIAVSISCRSNLSRRKAKNQFYLQSLHFAHKLLQYFIKRSINK